MQYPKKSRNQEWFQEELGISVTDDDIYTRTGCGGI